MSSPPLVSIITVTLNRVETLSSCLKSVKSQDYPEIEHILVDGGSTDGSLDLIRKEKIPRGAIISEKDRGLYDAMNKGLRLAQGEWIAFLNSDDVYSDPHLISAVVKRFQETKASLVYGDIVFFRSENPERSIRIWKTGSYAAWKLWLGWQIPHPALFIERKLMNEVGGFDLNFRIAADYDFCLRALRHPQSRAAYLPRVFVRMQMGGESTKSFKAIFKGNLESARSWKKQIGISNLLVFFMKPLAKVVQLRI